VCFLLEGRIKVWKVKEQLSLYRPVQTVRAQDVEAAEFVDSWHMKAARLSALCTSHFYCRRHTYYSFLLEAELTTGP
jgi:hypothetical protein